MKDLNPKLEAILIKHKGIEKQLSQQQNQDSNNLIKLNKEYSELLPLVDLINEYILCEKNIKNLKQLLDDQDINIKEMAEKELEESNSKLLSLKNNLLKL